MKFTGKIEQMTAFATGVNKSGNPWQSCKIIVCNINEGGLTERLVLTCLNQACEKVQAIARKYGSPDGSYSGEFDFFFTPSARFYDDSYGETRLACELYLNHIVEKQ